MSENWKVTILSHVLGLTGGIASGKSTVGQYLKKSGYPVIDADIIAREIMEPGESTYSKVVDYFGGEIVNKDRSINRKLLGEIVFSDNDKLRHLNALVQKDIFNEMMERKKEMCERGYPLIVMDIPLLYEIGYDDYVDEVMVVYTDYATQLSRLRNRDQLTEEEAVKRIEVQESLEIKKNKADVVIDNNGTISQTIQQIDEWLTKNGYSSPM
ncbi:dephospho-CoA kinase [Alkalibacterium sp.]|uniref:dephospho-CoA kinase n=1 Tax=Alkalibacterium sp. TaxID=1872447 RepID=UPI003970495F